MGQEEKYEVVPWFWSDQYDQKLQIVGMPDEHDEIVKREYADGFSLFYLSNKTIISVTTINNPKEFLICRKLVANKVKIKPEMISDTSTNLNDLI
jgi:3-phenylpropionate/trans-cinnamate dioxygenase ferredoxin reductase subunit